MTSYKLINDRAGGISHLSRSWSPSTKTGKTQLPMDFIPSEQTVICGRGKACSKAHGNLRLKAIVKGYLKQYSQAKNKVEKSSIVSSIVKAVADSNPHNPAFVKFEDGCWWEVEEGVAREKVGCILRDNLHTLYRSSTKAKLARRRASKTSSSCCNGQQQQQQQRVRVKASRGSGHVVVVDDDDAVGRTAHDSSFTMMMRKKSTVSFNGGLDYCCGDETDSIPSGSAHSFATAPYKTTDKSPIPQTTTSPTCVVEQFGKFQAEDSAFPTFANNVCNSLPKASYRDILGMDDIISDASRGIGHLSAGDAVFSALDEACALTADGLDEGFEFGDELDEACLLTADRSIEHMGLPDDISVMSDQDDENDENDEDDEDDGDNHDREDQLYVW